MYSVGSYARSVKVIRDSINDRLESFVAHVRRVYEQAYAKALETGRERVQELVRVKDGIGPKVSAVVQDTIGSAEHLLDSLNQELAQKAVPDFRKGTVMKDRLDALDVQRDVPATADKDVSQTKDNAANQARVQSKVASKARDNRKKSRDPRK